VKQIPARKPFVAPTLNEEASLEGVTLASLGSPRVAMPQARTTWPFARARVVVLPDRLRGTEVA